jgi:hypothetical protein
MPFKMYRLLAGLVKYAFSLKNYELIKQIFSLKELPVLDSEGSEI